VAVREQPGHEDGQQLAALSRLQQLQQLRVLGPRLLQAAHVGGAQACAGRRLGWARLSRSETEAGSLPRRAAAALTQQERGAQGEMGHLARARVQVDQRPRDVDGDVQEGPLDRLRERLVAGLRHSLRVRRATSPLAPLER
jgi:hypothetical protein